MVCDFYTSSDLLPPFLTFHDEIDIEEVRLEFKDTAFMLYEVLSIVAVRSLEENL